MSGRRTLLGAVLAGGASRRFGMDKTRAEVGGVPMLERAVDALAGVCGEVIVVSARPDTPTGPWRIVPDSREGRGPLAGIETGLLEAGRLGPPVEAVFVLAADLPLVAGRSASAIAGAFRTSGAPAVAAARDGEPGFEPLCGVYALECLAVVEGLLDREHSAARDLFMAVAGTTIALQGDVASLNVNTPEQLAAAERELEGSELEPRPGEEARQGDGLEGEGVRGAGRGAPEA